MKVNSDNEYFEFLKIGGIIIKEDFILSFLPVILSLIATIIFIILFIKNHNKIITLLIASVINLSIFLLGILYF